jgi:hypothetical protein
LRLSNKELTFNTENLLIIQSEYDKLLADLNNQKYNNETKTQKINELYQ